MFPLENKVHKKFLALFHMCMKKPLGSSQKFLFVKQRRHPPPSMGNSRMFPYLFTVLPFLYRGNKWHDSHSRAYSFSKLIIARYVHVMFTLCSRCTLINTLLQFQCIARVKHLYLLLGHYYVERAHLNQLIFLPQSEGSELNSAWRIVFNHSSRILSTL